MMTWIIWIIMFSTHMLFTVSQGFEVESICPDFVHMENVTIECRINSSQIGNTRCLVSPTTVTYIFTTPLGNTSNSLCKADFPNTTCDISKSGCGCTSKSGFMYIYNYTFIANQSLHSGVSFKCSIDCFGASPPLTQNHNSCAFIKVAPPVQDTTIFSSRAPTTGSTTLLTSASIFLNTTSTVSSSNVTSIAHTFDTTDHFPSDANTKDADCSAGCIAAIVISTILGIAIIIIIVIIIYKKWIKERIKGNEFLCCCKAHKKHKKSSCGWYPKDKCPSKKTPANTSVTVTRQVGPGGKTLESITVTRQVGPDGTTLESITATSEERPNESVTVTSLAVPKGTKLDPIPKLTNTENGGNVQRTDK